MKKKFATEDILAVLTGVQLNRRQFSGIIEVICSLVGRAVPEEELLCAWEECHDELLRQLAPIRAAHLIERDIDILERLLDKELRRDARQAIIDRWLIVQLSIWGDTIELEYRMEFSIVANVQTTSILAN